MGLKNEVALGEIRLILLVIDLMCSLIVYLVFKSFLMQGLCLVDWGRGIDLHLFPDDIEFEGDCRTSGFRCVEMQERKPWTFQVIVIKHTKSTC
jgi:checkpoint serine/threonine-protein kinase